MDSGDMSDKKRQLEGKVALLTGASQGIGKEIAIAFGAEGATVAINYRNEENRKDAENVAAEIKQKGGIEPLILQGDVTIQEEVQGVVKEVIERLGRIDILVNNAGVLSQYSVVEMPVEEWDRVISTNLRSVFLFTRLVVPGMIERKWGRIINIASQLGQIGGVEMSHYSASKGGIIAFTKSIARELGRHNVTANCIAPGPVETSMLEHETDQWRKAKLSELPLPRFGMPEEVAPTAVLLASEPGGNLYTGQTLGPNSGDVML